MNNNKSKLLKLLTSSLKIKFTFILLILNIVFVIVYILLVKKNYEGDKISYAHETQKNQVIAEARKFNSEINSYLFIGKTILLAYNPTSKSLSQQGQNLFELIENILAIEMFDESINEKIIFLDKKKYLTELPSLESSEIDKVEIRYLKNNRFLISTREMSLQKKWYRFQIIIKCPYYLPKLARQTLLLVQDQTILETFGSNSKIVNDFLKMDLVTQDKSTQIMELDSVQYLVSKADVGIGGLSFFILTPKLVLLEAINDLYRKSVIFVCLVAFLLVFLITHRVSLGIAELTTASNHMANHNFDFKVLFSSGDEVGKLANAFREMVFKIQNLIKDTAEKVRIESELEITQTVQETLFPKQKSFHKNHIKLFGRYITGSGCGGDWWWYWLVDNKIFVIIADGTQHGAAASLITSAAKATVAILERSKETNIINIADNLNHSLCQCSNNKLLMSALILEIDIVTNEIKYINCSHLGAVLLPSNQNDNRKLSWQELKTLEEPISPHLGQSENSNFALGSYSIEANQRLVLLTDGLVECKNQSSQLINDRAFYTNMIDLHKKTIDQPEVFIAGLFEIAQLQAAHQPIKDDQTAVVIDFRISDNLEL